MGESWNLYFGYHFIPIKCSGSFEIRKEGHFYLAFILFDLVCHFVLEAFLNKHALELLGHMQQTLEIFSIK